MSGHLFKHYSGCVCEWNEHLTQWTVDRIKQTAPPRVSGPHPATEDLNKSKGWPSHRWKKTPPAWLPLSWGIGSSLAFRLELEDGASLVSWACSCQARTAASDWNYTISFLGPPPCPLQILGQASLHNQWANSYCFSFFGKHSLIIQHGYSWHQHSNIQEFFSPRKLPLRSRPWWTEWEPVPGDWSGRRYKYWTGHVGAGQGRTGRPGVQSEFLLSKKPQHCPPNQGSPNCWVPPAGMRHGRPHKDRPRGHNLRFNLPPCVAMYQDTLRLFQESL